VNFIPRSLWAGKPQIGVDYAKARGQGLEGGQAGIGASISTGLIGQGVGNFGRLLGPVAAALLMSLWVAILARVDLQIDKLGRLPLYCLGLILTFNMGRDITLITLYPFVFCYLALLALDRWRTPKSGNVPQAQPLPTAGSAPGLNGRPETQRRGRQFFRPKLRMAFRRPISPRFLGASRNHIR
jgi:hypothetical protein